METSDMKEPTLLPLCASAVIPVFTTRTSTNALQPAQTSLLSAVPDDPDRFPEDKKLIESPTVSTNPQLYYHLPFQLDSDFGLLYTSLISSCLNISCYQRMQKFLEILPQASPLCSYENDLLLVFGGILSSINDHIDNTSEMMFLYIPIARKWLFYDTMPEARCYHAASLVNTTIYVTGGYSQLEVRFGEMMPSSKTFSFCLKEQIWKTCASMKEARACHAMVVFKSKLYVFGGRGKYGCPLSSVEMYDPACDVWETVDLMPQPRMGLSAVSLNNVIWIIGGETKPMPNSEYCFLSSVLSFDPHFKTWSTQPSLPIPKAYFSTVTFHNDIWLLGGAKLSDHEGSLKLYSLSDVLSLSTGINGHWQHRTNLHFPLHNLSSVIKGSKVYTVGGMNSVMSCPCNIINVIDVETGCYTEHFSIPMSIAGCCSLYISHEQNQILAKKITSNSSISKVAQSISLPMTKMSIETSQGNSLHDILPKQHSFTISGEQVEDSLPPPSQLTREFSTQSEESFILYQLDPFTDSLSKSVTEFKTEHSDCNMNLQPSDHFNKKLTDEPMEKCHVHKPTKLFKSTLIAHINTCFGHRILEEYDVMDIKPKYNVAKKLLMVRMLFAAIPFCIPSDMKSEDLFTVSQDVNKFVQSMNIEKEVHQKGKQEVLENESSFNDAKRSGSSPDLEEIKCEKLIYSERIPTVKPEKKVLLLPDEISFCYIHCDLDIFTLAEKFLEFQDLKFDSKENLCSFLSSLQRTRCTQEIAVPTILTVGGLTDIGVGNIIFRYDHLRNLWEYAGKIPESLMYHSVILLEDVIYVTGGFDLNPTSHGKIVSVDSVISYDLKERSWRRKACMLHSRVYHNAVVFNGQIYVVGGQDCYGNILSSVEAYDETENYWVEYHNMPYPVMGAAACIFDGCIYIIGGVTILEGRQCITSHIAVYNPECGRWINRLSLPYPVAYGSVTCTMNQLWLYGGLMFNGYAIQSVENVLVLDNISGQWSIAGRLSVPRHCTNVLAIESCCYVIGGISSNDNSPVDSNDLFLCSERRIVRLSPMPTVLIGTCAVLLPPIASRVYSRKELDNMSRHFRQFQTFNKLQND